MNEQVFLICNGWSIHFFIQNCLFEYRKSGEEVAVPGLYCILRAPAVADALTTGRGAVIERSAGGAGQDCL